MKEWYMQMLVNLAVTDHTSIDSHQCHKKTVADVTVILTCQTFEYVDICTSITGCR